MVGYFFAWFSWWGAFNESGNIFFASTIVNSLVQAITVAVNAFKNEWEVDVINISTGEIMVSLRDNKIPYFSNAIKEVSN